MFKNFKIGAKLGLLVGCALAGLLIATFVGLAKLKATEMGLETVYKDRVEPLSNLKVVADMYAVNIVDNNHKARNGNVTLKEAAENIKAAQKNIKDEWEKYTSTKMTAEEQKLIDESKPMFEKANASVAKLLSIIEKGDKDAIAEFSIKELYPVIDPISGKVSEIVELQLRVAKEEYQRGVGAYHGAVRDLTIISTVLALFLSIMCLTISRGIVRPIVRLQDGLAHFANESLASLSHAVEAMRNGDMTKSAHVSTKALEVHGKDETAQMSQSFNSMIESATATIQDFSVAQDNISEIVRDVKDAARIVSASSDNVSGDMAEANQVASSISTAINEVSHAIEQSASTSQDLAKGSEDLAMGASTTAQAVEELGHAILDVSEGSARQGEAAAKAKSAATAGATMVEETVANLRGFQVMVEDTTTIVHELGNKQEKIGDIVRTITEIAEQTNLLALNAAIEAARAGEHGRGFAVVAEEVRKLAERSGQATAEIGDLIAGIRNQVEQVVDSMNKTAADVREGAEKSSSIQVGLKEILESISDVESAAASNAAAVEAMKQRSDQVSHAVSSVASVSQQSAASAEELSATNEELTASAQQVTADIQMQTASIERVSRVSSELRTTAERLVDAVNKFTVREAADAQPNAPKQTRLAA